jgi:hypothetical protein
MGDILSSATDYEAVRQVLGVGSNVLPDSTITGLIYLDYVEGEIKELVTDWASILAGADQDTTRLKLAVVNWTAARLCGHLERNEGRDYKIADFAQRAGAVDWQQKAGELAANAARSLVKLSTFATPTARPKLFSAAGPTRSGNATPATWAGWLDLIQPTVVDWLEDQDE